MTAAADDFTPVRFTLADLPQTNWAAAFREIYGRAIVRHEIEPLNDEPPRLDVTMRALPGLGVSSLACSSFRVWRTSDQLDSDDLVLTVALAGTRRHCQRGREAEVIAGEAVLATCDEIGHTLVSARTQHVSFRMPRAALAPMVADIDDRAIRAIPRHNGALAMLVNYARIVHDPYAMATAELRAVAAMHIGDLAALALGATRDAAAIARRRGVRAARREAVRGDILGHIGDQALSLEAVARRQGISPVYVRKLLADDDTSFTDFVTMLRLSRAYRMLRDAQLDERTIASIALAVGFADPTYFNRVFRRRFGMTPSDVRKEAAAQRA